MVSHFGGWTLSEVQVRFSVDAYLRDYQSEPGNGALDFDRDAWGGKGFDDWFVAVPTSRGDVKNVVVQKISNVARVAWKKERHVQNAQCLYARSARRRWRLPAGQVQRPRRPAAMTNIWAPIWPPRVPVLLTTGAGEVAG